MMKINDYLLCHSDYYHGTSLIFKKNTLYKITIIKNYDIYFNINHYVYSFTIYPDLQNISYKNWFKYIPSRKLKLQKLYKYESE